MSKAPNNNPILPWDGHNQRLVAHAHPKNWTVASTIHPYPTQAEAIRKTGDLYNCTRLTPFVKNLMNKWLAWIRL